MIFSMKKVITDYDSYDSFVYPEYTILVFVIKKLIFVWKISDYRFWLFCP